ncbi:amino acid adenylation domain-containing protein [Nocardiopsis sp. N85]|uniref:non-ribosomal peptide synthetase n=1 Tax=Nocardiopsis sp. N85 TaxID=3029400 RepID=UPI00237F3B3D|nr:non-ribosomal peptide synthetase [Nocardiopsis sp. N85]MDE3722560.1 amino acid adenylation domain-containing protein [Nocardiopsis sp. N85]
MSSPQAPAARTFPELFAARAARRPEATALVTESGTLTYASLAELVERRARGLLLHGVRPGDIVGVHLERGRDTVVSLLAIMRAGAAHLPLDPAYPAERLAYMITDSGAGTVITANAVSTPLPDGVRALTTAEADAGAGAVGNTAPTDARPLPDDIAYVIYTSGSTGRPKGVLVTHRGIGDLAATQRVRMEVTVDSRILQFASPSFDASVFEVCMALLNGAALVVLPRPRLLGEELISSLREHRITHVTLPPAVLPGLSPTDLTGLRAVMVAGEACPSEIVNLWSRGRRMYNGYGPTETTVCATMSAPLSGNDVPPIGRAVDGTTVHVLDERLRPVPEGGIGELYISGAGLARGYHGRAGLTAERFVPDPFGPPGSRMYRSGDVVRLRPDGDLEFRGRSDHQVKLRGFRIEPGEIEDAATRVPEVATAAVLVREDRPGIRRLVAYVAGEPHGPAPDGERVRAALAERLPDHMVPSVVVALPALPTTPNGKIDRALLPAPDEAAPEPEYTAPRDDTERVVCEEFAAVLCLDRVGAHDDFFSLGGDSILAVRALSRIDARLGTALDRRSVFAHPTPARLASEGVGGTDATRPITRVDRGRPLPLSAAQRRLWFLHQHHRGGAEYHTGSAHRLTGKLSVPALQDALTGLRRRHEILRTTYATTDEGPVQVIGEPSEGGAPLSHLDLAGTGDLGERLEKVLTAEVERPFDLGEGGPFRALLVRLGEDDHLLVLSFHHIACDGWSVDLLARDLTALYRDRTRGRSTAEPEADRLDYADFAVWEQGRWDGPDADGRLAYWRRELDGARPLEVPCDRPRPTVRTTAGAVHRLDLGPVLTDALKEAGRRRGSTLFTTLTALTQLLLSTASGSVDVTLGVASAGRDHHQVDDVVGFFVNPLVIRSRIDPASTLGGVADGVRSTVLTAFEHEMPFERVVDAVATERDPGRTPLFQALMVLQNAHSGRLDLPGLQVRPVDLPRTSSLFDLVFEFTERDGGLRLALEYNTDLYDQERIAGLARGLRSIAELLANAPETAVARIDVRGDDERRVLASREGGGPEGSVPTLPEAFAAQVARAPEATAVSGPDGELTYAELDAASFALAARLRAHGAGDESPVLVVLERGVSVVTAMLAVVRAGAAYVPVHVNDPVERVARLAEETGAVCAIADAASADRVPARPGLTVIDPDGGPVPPDGAPVRVHPKSLAYVMFTSGSTGTPKGVAVAHDDIVRLARDRRWRGGGHDRLLFHSSHAFDAATYEIWVPLLNGGTVVVAPPGHLDAEGFAAVVARHGATGTFVTSSLFNLYASQDPACFSGLREVLTGGEAANPGAVERVRRACPGTLVSNVYGPTETTTYATTFTVEGEGPVPTPVPIGDPLDGTRVCVLDPLLRRTPEGAVGELYIGGAGVARGYRGRPGTTAERFVADPFGSGERLYRTGDLVRWNRDGRLEYTGRADAQVKLRGFRIEPGEVEAALLRSPQVAEAVVLVHRSESGARRLVGYVVGAAGPITEAGAERLREALTRELPAYMVPGVLVPLDAMPLNANGKVDRRALPEPPSDGGERAFTAPRSERERALTEVFASVLGADRVGVHDDFFALGGDSILSIQVVSRARRSGLTLTSQQVFSHPTVAALAAVATTDDHHERPRLGPTTGPVTPTPIMRWFLRTHPVAPEHFNMSVLLDLAEDTDAGALVRAVDALVAHHDMLRLCMDADGAFRIAGVDEVEPSVETVDLSGTERERVDDVISEHVRRVQAGLEPAVGRMLRAVLFTGDEAPSRLLIVAHHLVVDGVSWRILLEDLTTAHHQLTTGTPLDLGPRTTPFPTWADHLTTLTTNGHFNDETDHWNTLAHTPTDLPHDHHHNGDGNGNGTIATQRSVSGRLSPEVTRALLREVPPVFRTRVNDLLLAALGRVLGEWTGRERLLVDLEGHGREDLSADPSADLDLSRTVGWFTTLFPVALTSHPDWEQQIKTTKEMLRSVPRHGIGFGALHHLGPGLEHTPQPRISFNYLGRFDTGVPEEAPYTAMTLGGADDADADRAHLIDVVGRVVDERLTLDLAYSDRVHTEDTARGLLESLATAVDDLVDFCLGEGVGGATPSDFPLVELDQQTLDRLVTPHVQDVLPLTPMQQGMLFHSLLDDGSSYLEQIVVRLEGVDSPEKLADAWRRTYEATPALRAVPAWEGLTTPVQLITDTTPLPITIEDLSHLNGPEQENALQAFTDHDRTTGIDLTTGPLMRIGVVRLSPTRTAVTWTFHHLLLDGWSLPLILDDVFTAYRDQPLPARPAFRDHLHWLARQDTETGLAHWRDTLTGIDEPTPLPYDRTPEDVRTARSRVRVETHLDEERSASVHRFAREHGLTVNALVQGAWALLLSAHSGRTDTVFGATTSGRPADRPDIENAVGIYINTLPVRVRVTPHTPVTTWLRELQDRQVTARRYDHLPLSRIQGEAGLPGDTQLFDSIVVFENYPVNAETARRHGIEILDVTAEEATNYPLALSAYATERIRLIIGYEPDHFDRDTALRLLDDLSTVLGSLVLDPERPLGAVTGADASATSAFTDGGTLAVPDLTVPELFAEQVRARPDAVALVGADREWTYAELDRRSDEIAGHLRAHGAGHESRVFLSLPRSPRVVVAMLGVLKAGATYVPLHDSVPAERVAALAAGNGVDIAITDPVSADLYTGSVPITVHGYGPEGITLLAERPGVERDVRPGRARPASAAYVMFTSGSTGTPKGVVVDHRNIVAFTRDGRWGRGHDRILFHSPHAFDAATHEIWTPLLNGGTVMVAPEQGVTADMIRAGVRDHGVTAVFLTTALFNLFAGQDPGCFAGLRQVWTGGEAADPASFSRVLRACGDTRVVHVYGPTETTTFATCAPIGADLAEAGECPIGAPMDGTRTHILDAALRPVPVGAVGELYIAGDGVARGYDRRPAATAERFVADPFGSGGRLYRTGDLVRWRKDGLIEFVGRADGQIKLRGHRIELGEIEAALANAPGVAQAAATVVAAPSGARSLAGYLTEAVPGTLDTAAVTAELARTLPAYMIPSSLTVLASLPLNANGKVDRRALPAPADPRPEETDYAAPETPTEELVAEVWSTVLRRDRVGRDDNFFDIGGDSVKSIQVVGEIRRILDVTVPTRALFDHQTVRSYARAVEDGLLGSSAH